MPRAYILLYFPNFYIYGRRCAFVRTRFGRLPVFALCRKTARERISRFACHGSSAPKKIRAFENKIQIFSFVRSRVIFVFYFFDSNFLVYDDDVNYMRPAFVYTPSPPRVFRTRTRSDEAVDVFFFLMSAPKKSNQNECSGLYSHHSLFELPRL